MFWIENDGASNKKMFYAEYETDVANLPKTGVYGSQTEDETVESRVANEPCSSGSKCLVIENGDVYILQKSTNTWELLGG